MSSEAIERVRQYVKSRTEKPFAQLDDTIHGIHTGTKWAGELRLSDLRELLKLVAPEVAAIPNSLLERAMQFKDRADDAGSLARAIIDLNNGRA